MCDHPAFVLDLRNLSKVLVSDTRAFIAVPGSSFPAHLSKSACLGHERAVSTAKVGTPTTRRGHVC